MIDLGLWVYLSMSFFYSLSSSLWNVLKIENIPSRLEILYMSDWCFLLEHGIPIEPPNFMFWHSWQLHRVSEFLLSGCIEFKPHYCQYSISKHNNLDAKFDFCPKIWDPGDPLFNPNVGISSEGCSKLIDIHITLFDTFEVID